MGRIHSLVRLARNDDDTVNGLLEGVNPVRAELAVDSSAGVTQVLRISELATGKCGVANIIVNPKLGSVSALASLTKSNAYRVLPSKARHERRRC